MKKGFTLIEVLVVVVIIAVLTTVALPRYMRTLERARATEAMTDIKAINEAIYAYAMGKDGQCPPSFSKLLVSLSGTSSANDTVRTTKNFIYRLNGASNALVPGTDCAGVTARRNASNRYNYIIWNPYIHHGDGRPSSLACTGTAQIDIDICESLNLYEAGITPGIGGGITPTPGTPATPGTTERD
ncbi:MAG: prepilin-type N-terminal cleavage/methylation domain-containing protein [Elusimicrobiaceae bacterium]|nr:prepilin-type N-terminal cleavage/methylation domain-containing protein [Elusimicrobiaceae bacterium]